MKPLIIAHRGDTINFKENTLEAFDSAFKHEADGIELDTHLDSNGKIVIVHDFGFDESLTYPLLEDVLKKFGDKGRLEIEIKSPHEKAVEKVISIIEKIEVPDYEVTSGILYQLPKVRDLLPEGKIGLIFNVDLLKDWMTKEYIRIFIQSHMEMTKANVLHLPIDFYDEENVEFFKSKGFILHAHLGFEINKFQKVVGLQIDQCTLDDATKIKYLKGLQDYFGQTD